MRALLTLALVPTLFAATPALQIVNPVLSQMDGGAPDPPGFEHVPGEIVWFTCRIAGYTRNENEKVQLRYSVQAFDPQGIPLDEIFQNEMTVEVGPQDKDWLPKIATSLALPPLAPPGDYKIVVKAEDLLAKTSTEFAYPFKVRGKAVEPSPTLIVRNFQFFRDEDGTRPAEKPDYHPGDGVFAKFDITGFKYGDRNKVDVSYVTSVIAPSGKVMWTQPEPAAEQSESFYPKRYVPATMGINLTPTIKPGEYTIAVAVKDAIGGQTYEAKFPFTVQ
ncbi:MAG TPA: hypothetical protein VKX45_24700 [Bryobacteraceae bacterium]|jgi:hypothetical protein|nr:hypothetical protein [Bryobacteraceae bacterium]